MMSRLKKAVDQLVHDEYALASEQYGPKHNTPHEAYAVMKEELEEAQHEVDTVDDKLNIEYWRGVMYDSDLTCTHNAKEIRDHAIKAACEMIQVAAMAEKTLKGYGRDEK